MGSGRDNAFKHETFEHKWSEAPESINRALGLGVLAVAELTSYMCTWLIAGQQIDG